jgi:hypothetical protein
MKNPMWPVRWPVQLLIAALLLLGMMWLSGGCANHCELQMGCCPIGGCK